MRIRETQETRGDYCELIILMRFVETQGLMKHWEFNGGSLDSGRLIETHETQADCWGIMRLRDCGRLMRLRKTTVDSRDS